MNLDFIKYLPPILQIVILIIVGLAALASVINTLSRSSKSETGRSTRFIEYVLIPIIVFGVLLTLIITNWDSSAPFFGDFTGWGTTVKRIGIVILGIVPSALCFGALFPLTNLADKKNPEKPLATVYGKLYLICLILTVILLPLGIAAAVSLDEYLSGGN
jgi:hypothetical protein